ncbi:ABC transporter permease [Spiroplasma turonicum]|uniref:Ribose/galactose ABC transporter permease n=1 Tax=Spiroplasma turonicum TaxID=216946 RepID=A0A0K1P6R0_9MOLU|nr:ABC transporter permease [Spiroplasma turonicum]AKU79562.1 ribose/galactose ABC transporter permease [Spiroplasma turonicum]ALX70585.1 ribose/galactose ABC transporter permease [Spiroplasma turonicum]
MASNLILESLSIYFVIFSLASLAGIISERSGVINVGIDGMMVVGALTYAIVGSKLYKVESSNIMQIVPIIVASIVAGLFALLHAFASIKLKADQIVSGTAINLFAQGLAMFLTTSRGWTESNGTLITAGYSIISFSGANNVFTIYLLISFLVTGISGIYFSFTRTGNRHIAVGENPNAVSAVGINVYKYRYLAVIVSGMIAGISGACFVIIKNNGNFFGTVNGFGFIALAIMIVGQWKIRFTVIASFIFSLFFTIGERIFYLTNDQWIKDNSNIFNILPFLLSLITMVTISKYSKPPKSIGQPYDESKR